MNPPTWSKQHVDEVLMEGLVDWVDPGWITSSLMDDIPDAHDRMVAAISLVSHLLTEGLMIPGDLDQSGHFAPRFGPARDEVSRITAAWLSHSRRLSPPAGEVVWLTNTPDGDKRGQEYSRALDDEHRQ